MCIATVPIPSEWFSHSEPMASMMVQVRLLSSFMTQDLGNVVVNAQPPLTFTNDVAFQVPSRPLHVTDVFSVPVYGHATYSIAAYSIKCQVGNNLALEGINLDTSTWITEVRPLNISGAKELGVAAILIDPEAAVEAVLEQPQLLFSFEVQVLQSAVIGTTEHVNCTTSYLSNIYNEKIQPRGLVTPAPSLSIGSLITPGLGEVRIVEAVPRGLFSFADQSQVVNLPVLTGHPVSTPMTHIVVMSSGTMEEIINLQCNTTSRAFSLSSNCLSYVLYGNESVGAAADSVVISYQGLTSEILLRVWYPSSQTTLESTPAVIRPVAEWDVLNSSNQCVQQYQPASLNIFTDFSYDNTNSPVTRVSVLPLVAHLVRSSNPDVVDVTGNGFTLLGLSPGTSEISAGSFITPLTITVLPDLITVASLDVTLFSGLSLSLMNQPYPILSTQTAIVNVQQIFDSISSEVFLSILALLDDGSTVLLDQSVEMIGIRSVNPQVVSVANGNISLLGRGMGDLVEVAWLSPCTGLPIAIANGSAVVRVPDPTTLDIQQSATKITYPDDTATVGGVPISLTLSVLLVFPDGLQRDVTHDSQTSYLLLQGADLVTLTRTDSALLVTPSDSNRERFGEVEVLITFGRFAVSSNVSFNVVRYLGVRLSSTPYPPYPGSSIVTKSTLFQIEQTGQYQQVSLVLQALLSDNSSVIVTQSPLAFYQTISQAITINGNILSVSEAGTYLIEGLLGSDISYLSVNAVNESVFVASFDNFSIPTVRETFSGIRGESTLLNLDVSFSDSTRYPSFIPTATNIFPHVLSLTGNTPSAISINPLTGQIMLQRNHYSLVTVTVATTGPNFIHDQISFACNLLPEVRDIDLGQPEGIPIPEVTVGANFSVPVAINSGTQNFGTASFTISYNSNLNIVGVNRNTTWSGDLQYRTDTPGFIHITASSSSGSSGLIYLGILEFQAAVTGVGSIGGVITQTSLGGSVPQVFIAGQVEVSIVSTRLRRSASFEDTSLHRSRRNTECISAPCASCPRVRETGDTNGDCIFNYADVQFLLSFLSEELFDFNLGSGMTLRSSLLVSQLLEFDADLNTVRDIQDAYFLHQVQSGLLNFLKGVLISPVQESANCMLSINSTLLGSGDVPPNVPSLDVYFDIALAFDSSFTSQRLFDESNVLKGSLVSTITKGLALPGGILRAELLEPGVFGVVIETNLTMHSIGLSVIQVSSLSGVSSSQARTKGMFGSPDPPYAYNTPLLLSFPVFSDFVQVRASPGYSPFTTFNNTMTTLVCITPPPPPVVLEPVVQVMLPENITAGTQVLVVSAQSQSDLPAVYSISSGNTGGVFDIGPSDGIVRVLGALDYETNTNYTLTIAAADPASGFFSTVIGEITVTDINDNPPIFVDIPHNITVPANTPIGAIIIAAIAVQDADDGSNADVNFSVEPRSTFAIDTTRGTVTLQQMLDFNVQNVYLVTIVAQDMGTPPLSSSSNVTVIVLPPDPTVLQFNSSVYMASVVENSPDGALVIRLSAMPVSEQITDMPVVIEYALDTPGVPFSLDARTGQLVVNGTIDREVNPMYQVEVSAMVLSSERSFPAFAIVNITVEDLNDNSPVFSERVYRATVVENTSAQALVTVSARDSDAGSNGLLVYSLEGASSMFAINGSSGLISSTAPLNYEDTAAIQFFVVATDLGMSPLSSTSEVSINVTDINDNPPVLTITPSIAVVPESLGIGEAVAIIEVMDADSTATNGKIDISLIDFNTGNIAERFAITSISSNATGGNETLIAEVSLAGSLDYEMQQVYSLVVRATDTGTPPMSVNVTFTVNVVDVNDNSPIFNQPEYNFTISEDVIVPFIITILNASDGDSGSNTAVEFFLIDSIPSTNKFNITTDGALKIVESLDYETTQMYILTVAVRNTAVGASTDIATVNIQVSGVNEFAPSFTQEIYQASFLEETAGAFVIQVRAIDMDLNDIVMYSLIDGNFTIDLNGTIRTARSLDRELLNAYNITVLAMDSDSILPLSSSAIVVATVEDINDNPPVFAPFQNISILDSTRIGTVIARFAATDTDAGTNSEIGSFSLLPPVPEFSITPDGQLSVASSLNARATAEYILGIFVNDQGTPPLNATTTFSILVEQLPVPIFNESQYNVSVFENARAGTFLVQVQAFTINPEAVIVSYQLQTTSLSEVFSVDRISGNITSIGSLDRERNETYVIEVEAVSELDSLFFNSSTTVIINVLDINDNPPIFDISSSVVASVNETVSIGTIIANFVASDMDVGDNAIIEYSITSGNEILQLGIDSSGTVFAMQTLVDKIGLYSLTITASNPVEVNPLSATANLTLEVLPVNRFTPTFNMTNYRVNIPEDTQLNSEVITLVANDTDLGSAGIISYTITNIVGSIASSVTESGFEQVSGINVFAIDNITGSITLQETLDYENATAYTLTVQARDNGMPSRSSAAFVEIHITDVNDNPPVFSQSLYTGSVDENAAAGQFILRVAVTDKDSSINSVVTFDIVSSNIGDFFRITSDGDLETIAPLDHEITSTATLIIMASNVGSNITLTATSMVEITINDMNDNAPVFSRDQYLITLQAPVLQNTTILQVTAMDADSSANNSRVQFRLQNSSNEFVINSNSGNVQTVADIRTERNVSLTVIAFDNGSPVLSSQSQITIYILAPDDLTANRERDLVFSVGGSANLFGRPIELTPTMYQQLFGFSVSPDGTQQHTVTAQLGPLTSTLVVTPNLLPAIDVRASLAYDEIWPDQPEVSFTVQARDRTHNVHVSTTVFVQATHPQIGSVINSCTTQTSNGICQVNLNIPLTWFETGVNATTSFGLSQSSLDMLRTIQLQAQPTFTSSMTAYTYMAMPLRPLFVGDTFLVPVYGRTGSRGVGSYTATVQGSSDVDLASLTFDSVFWVAEVQSGSSGISITAVLSDQTTEPSPGETLLFTISARVSTRSREDTLLPVALTATIRELNDFNRVRLLPPSGSSSTPSFALSRNGITTTGVVYVASDPVVNILPYVERAELTNTAVLNDVTTREPIVVLGVHRSGRITTVSDTSRLTCTSSAVPVVSVTSNCSSIFLSTSQTRASVSSAINVLYDGISTSFPVQIWVPVSVSLVVADVGLQMLANVPNLATNCTPVVQSTYVYAFANITNSVEFVDNIDVTQLIQLFSSNQGVVEVRDNQLFGANPGISFISGLPASGEVTFNAIEVSTIHEPVELLGLDVRVVTGLQLVGPQSIQQQIPHISIASDEQVFDFEGTEGRIITTAVFADGSRVLLSDAEVTYTTPFPNIVDVSGSTVTALASGSGNLVHALWRAPVECGSQPIQTGIAAVTVNIPRPDSIVAGLSNPILALPQSTASMIGVGTSATLEVSATYGDGRVQMLATDNRTQYAFPSNIDVTRSSESVVISTNSNATVPGDYYISITFIQFPDISVNVTYTIVSVVDIALTANPYPIYPGSQARDVRQLSVLGTSSVLQQALIVALAGLSSGSSINVTSNTQLVLGVTASSQALQDSTNIRDGAVANILTVTSLSTGTLTVSASLREINSSTVLTIDVVLTPVHVIEINIVPFPSNTFRGIVDVSTRQVVISVTFNDTTQYPNLFQDFNLPNLVNFESSPSSALTINSLTGLATLRGNFITLATITVTSLGPSPVSSSIDVACNLDPDVGDVDVGSTSGLPIPAVSESSEFTVQVRVNSGTATLDSIEVDVVFDPTIVRALSATEGNDWPSTGQFAFTADDPQNTITIGGTLVSSIPVQGTALHLATITFQAIRAGVTNITGVVHTLARQGSNGEVAMNIGTVPRSFIAGSVQVMVTGSRLRRSATIPDLYFRMQRSRRQAVMGTCLPQRETGDVDGNCVFDVRDVSFLQRYYLSTVVTGVEPGLPEDRRVFLDADLNGEINANDVVFLLRVNFRLLRFASALTFLPVLLTNENCMMEINVTLTSRGDVPADSSSTVLLFDIANENPGFQALFDASNVTVGRVVTTDKGSGLYGGLVEASYYGAGMYGIKINSALGPASFGISPIQVTFDADNVTGAFRMAAMFSQNIALYGSLDTNIILRGTNVSISTQLGYAPLLLANSSLDTQSCLLLRSALMFQNSTYTAMVSEGANVGDVILIVAASSPRTSPLITYSISSGTPYSINAISGVITVNQPLDYEDTRIYEFTAMAIEQSPSGDIYTDSASVFVSVTNENDVAPNITQPPITLVLATLPPGNQVVQILATDPDNLDPLNYVIDNSALFSIDPSTGTVTVSSSLLGAANSNVTVSIRVMDSLFSSSTDLTVDIYLPGFSQDIYLANISEATAVGRQVLEVMIDNTRSENFTFSLQSDAFAINGFGDITVNAPLDYESQPAYTLNITATSSNIQLWVTVSIFLLDVNDNAPMFSDTSINVSVSMSITVGTVVTQLIASDRDSPGPNSDISYSIVPSENSNLFGISEFSGQVNVLRSLFQGPSVVAIVIVAADNGIPVMSTSVNLIIEIESSGIPSFAIPPSVSASGTAVTISSALRASSVSSNTTIFQQMYTKLSAVATGRLSVSFSRSSKTSTVEFTSVRQAASNVVTHVLHPTNIVYQESRDIILAFQLRDINYFTGVAQSSVERQVVLLDSNQNIISSLCTVIQETGICTTRLSIPEDWFNRSSSIVVASTFLNGVLMPTSNVTLILQASPVLSQPITNNLLVEVPSRDILSGTVFTMDVYGYSPFNIAGFSIVFEAQGPISITNTIIDATRWNILTTANATLYGVTSILTTPGLADTNRNENRVFLFSLILQADSDLSSAITAYVTAQIQSLSNVVEGSVLLGSSSSTSGPALFLSRAGQGNNGSVNIVPNAIQAVYPYIQQPEILNTALLTGTDINIPVQIFAGYASGDILLYTQGLSCSSSEPQVINPEASCAALVLTMNETAGSNSVVITYTVGKISGLLPIRVYAPTRPLLFITSDPILNRIQYPSNSPCTNYQRAELSIFANFEASSNQIISNVSVTDLLSSSLISTNTSTVDVNKTTIIGRAPGDAAICVNNRPDLGCLTVAVSDNAVNVSSLVGSLLVEVNLVTSLMVDSSSENVAEIQARSEFQFLQEEGDLLVAVQFTDGAFSPVSPSEVTLVAPEDTSIYSVQGSILTAIGSGEAVGQFEWNPLSGQCSLNLVDYFLVSSRLPIPAAIQTSLLPLPAVHYLTTSTDQAALLVGLPSSLSISVSLLFPSGRTLDVSHDSRVSYSSSSPALMVSNGIITASEEATTQLVVSYATAEVNLTAVINIQVVVSVGITPSAYPYPTYPGSTSTNLVQLSLIESTGVWQRAVLDVRLILSNGTSIDVTSFSETQFRANALPPGQAIPETDITLSPLPVLSVRGGIGIVEVVAIFSPHISTLTISILNNRVFINAVEVLPFPQDTLRGIRGSTTQTVSVHLTFTDGTRFISYPNNPAFLGQMLAGLVNYSTTDNSFTVSSMGELQPLANSHLRLTLRVAAVSNMSVASNYNFVVNLDPEVGDVDIGMRTGSAIPASSVGSQLNLPVVINSGSSSVGSVDLLVTYDATIIEPTQVTMGPDFGSGIYEASLNDPPGELRLGGAFSTDIFGTSLHLFNINVRFLAPTFPEGSFLRGTVITLATRAADGSSIGLPTPRPMVAGNLTFSVSGRSKRSSMEGVAAQSRQQTHFRHRRQATCSAPPCACSWMTPGDTDGNCLFDVRDVSFILLYINQALVGSSGMAVTTPAQLSQLDPNQDGIVDTSDAFFLLRALFRLIYFMDNLSVTAVQNPLSQCLFSVNVQLRSAQELPLKAADVIIDFGFPDSSSTIVARDVVTGDFLTSDKGNGLNGALVLAQQSSDRTFNVQLNATFVSDSVGVSVVLVTFDALNATTSSRSVQFFGRPPPLYPSPLSLSLSLRGASVLVAASSGYSPFQFASNAIPSAQCSNIPILGPDLNVTFVSPFLAELSWILLNLREGLNFSMELKLQVATCEVSQDEEILNDTCSGIVVHDVRGSTFHDLPTKPFTLYYLQVSAPTSATDNITAQSPESPPMGLAPPLYSQKPDSTSFRWSLPALPNGVITHYVLYVGSVAVYNGSALSFSSTIVFQDTASVVLEAHNRAGSTRSDSILVSPIIGPDPGVRGLSLAAEEAIVIAIVLTGVIILVLVIVMLFGMWRRRMTEKAKKKPDFLSSNFEPENFEVVRIFHLLFYVRICYKSSLS